MHRLAAGSCTAGHPDAVATELIAGGGNAAAPVVDSVRQLAAPVTARHVQNGESQVRRCAFVDEVLAVGSILQGCSSMWQPRWACFMAH